MFKLSKSVYPLSKNLTHQAKTLVSIAIALPIISLTGCGVNTGENTANTPGTTTAVQPIDTTKPVKLTLVSYAVTQKAYEQIIPKFVEKWKAETGQTVQFDQSYGGSGSQTRAVIDGLEADVVALALGADTQKVEEAGLIQPGWEKELPNDAIVHKSVAALVTREGIQINNWSDLVSQNLQVITANPKTSGGARWNFLALWGAVSQAGGTPEQSQDFVQAVFKNVPVLPKDAREATDVFYKQGQGDVLINYENELILAKQQGNKQPYFVPTDYNVSIDSPVAVVDANVDKHGTRAVAEAFTQFLFTPEAQREFAKVGFRPIDPAVYQEFSQEFPQVNKLLTVKDLGGWQELNKKFFADGAIFDQVLQKTAKNN